MDVEKTMEFILEQLAHVAVLQAKAEERQGEFEKRQDEFEKRQDKMDRRLTRAVRLAVEEARRERARRRDLEERTERARQEMEQAITRLAAAQLVTEEKLQRFLEWRSGSNGKA